MSWKPFAPAFNADFDDLPREAQKAAFAAMDEDKGGDTFAVGDRIKLTPKTATVGLGAYKTHPKQEVLVEAIDKADNGGQVLRFTLQTAKGQLKTGYVNTKLEKVEMVFSPKGAGEQREKEQEAALKIPGAKLIPEAQTPKKFRNMTHAARELGKIRDEAARPADAEVDIESLIARTDAVGQWAAKHAKPTGMGADIIHEAHKLREQLTGTTGRIHSGTRIRFQ